MVINQNLLIESEATLQSHDKLELLVLATT